MAKSQWRIGITYADNEKNSAGSIRNRKGKL